MLDSTLVDFIFNKHLKKYLKYNDKNMYILKNDLEKLNKDLTVNEKNYIKAIIKSKNIAILDKADLTKSSKSRRTADYVYGEIISANSCIYEENKFSKITFNANGEVIDTDFSELESFLKEKFIPYYAKERTIDEVDNRNNYLVIHLKDILLLALSELELTHTMFYLSKLNIYVMGRNYTLNKEFPNYHCTKFKETDKNEFKSFSSKVLNDMIRKYKITNDQDLRDKIILSFQKFIKKRAIEYSHGTSIEALELESYGYEGVIKALENYDVNREEFFSSYAFKYIKGYMKKGKIKLLGYKEIMKAYPTLITIRNEINIKYGKDILDDPKYMDKFINIFKKIKQNQNIESRENSLTSYKNIFQIKEPYFYEEIFNDTIKKYDEFDFSLDEYLEHLKEYYQEYITYENDCYDIHDRCENEYNGYELKENLEFSSLGYDSSIITDIKPSSLKEEIASIFNTLNEKEATILKLRFGFIDNKPRTLTEIGNYLKMTPEGVNQNIHRTLKKLRKNEKIKQLQ